MAAHLDNKAALTVHGDRNPEQNGSPAPATPAAPVFTTAELSIIYRAVMELPMKRSDPAFAAADGVLGKIGLFAQAQQAAAGATRG